ncbi:hypothetical protein Pint_27137 [Pistacia integerrima]|uniref:Uncharacterized protein n=1 Tax=Pistacia integerrima TaxID=434235 RepID=A0ACC0YQI5_9ROSI|nr:hypothetical protein Pint_27137 [Pistacia integerrima]
MMAFSTLTLKPGSSTEKWLEPCLVPRNSSNLPRRRCERLHRKASSQFLSMFLNKTKEFDLKDLLNRGTFDFACAITAGYSPNFLSMEQPEVPFVKAINDACEAIFFRYVLPERLWKLQRWMGIGKERKLSNGWRSLDCFWEECFSCKREKMSQVVATTSENKDEESFIDFLEFYLSGNEVTGATPSEKVMRDNVIGLILGAEGATGITLSWFFWLLSKNNPLIEAKIREEITENLPCQPMKFTPEDLSKLVYLHAALCETLRLFPPVPFQLRKNEETDTLPSGHEIR